MIEVWFPPSTPFDVKYSIGNIYWRHQDRESLGINQQIMAQILGWA